MVQFPFPQLWESEKMAGGNSGGFLVGKRALPPLPFPLMVLQLWELWGSPKAGLASTWG